MSTFTTTGPLVRFTDTDGDVSFVASSPRVTFTAAYQSVTGGGGGGATDLDDLTDVTITAAAAGDILRHNGTAFVDVPGTDYYRDVYAPALVMSPAAVTAFGGSMVNGVSLTIAALSGLVPSGFDVLIWNGTAGAAPNGSYTSDGAGNFTYSSRQYLNATSFGNGCQLVTGPDQVTAGSTGGPSVWKIVTANGTDYGLTAVGGYALSASYNLSQYATDADLAGYATDAELSAVQAALDIAEQAIDAAVSAADDQHHDALTAAHYATDPPAAWFVYSGSEPTNDAWSTGDIPELSGMPDMRALIYFERDVVEQFSEIWTRWFDSDGAAEDSPELAIFKSSPTAKPRIYAESVRDGGTTDETDVNVEFDLERVWMPVRVFYNSTGTLCTAQVGVRWDGDSTTSGRHTEWRTIATQARPAGIDWNTANDWILGLHFEGRIAWAELYDGDDGTLVAAPDATDWTTGTSFTDSEGNVWTTTTGAVAKSLDARVDTLEAAPSTVDVVSNVATSRILGRTSSGSGDSEELTVADVRTLLAQNGVVLHNETVASDAASKSYDVTGWDKIRVEFMGRSTRNGTTDSLLMTLNANTGSVYSTNAAALTTALTLGTVAGINTNTDRLGLIEAELALMSGWLKAGYSRGTNLASTAAVGAAVVHNGLFSTITAAVTTVELKMSLANIVAGSRIRIIGLQ